MSESLLLQAFKGTNTRVPVWFMRQAGRYLPEYQALKADHNLQTMFQTPELAAQVTLMPINILGVDAAILFADILTLPSAMGFNIAFDNLKGPIIETKTDLSGIHDFEDLSYITKTIKLVKDGLPEGIALIGFAGSPFTVLTYLIEGGSSQNFIKTHRFIQEQPETFTLLMERLTSNTINYLKLQQEAGVDCFQLFDTWAGVLRPADFARFVLPHIKRIFESVALPSIYFAKPSNHLLPLMDQCGSDFLSVDHTVVLGHHTIIEKTKKGVQGNLFNGLLYADQDTLTKEVNDVLVGGTKHERFIFNLNHGVFKDTAVEKLKSIVQQVHAFEVKR